MTTTTKSRSPKSKATPKTTPEVKPEATTEAKPEAPKAKAYRELPDYTPALKAARSLSKGNPELSQPLQLITHLAWKTPTSTVGWSKGTTANVIAYADDIAVPVGTPISEAMQAALSAAQKAATTDPQKEAVAALAAILEGHGA